MIQGWARRKTMKRHRLNPIVSSPRKTKRTPGKQWPSTPRSPPVESKVGQRWKASATLQGLTHCNLTACLCLGRQEDAWSAAGRGERGEVSKRGVETAVMIRGWAHRKTMKCPRLDPIGSHPRKTKGTPGKQWSATARSPRWRAMRASGERKQRWKYQRHSNGRNTANSPPACALADCNLSGRLRVVVSVGEGGGVETAVMIQGRTHRKTMKRHRLNPLSLLQRKRREHRSSNGHQQRTLPPVESKAETSVETSGDTPMSETLQPHCL